MNHYKQKTATATIEKCSHEFRGIARIDGKATFIEGALPEERVSFSYTRKKKEWDEGRVVSIEEASMHRVTPLCAHYERCGGCSLQHLAHSKQIEEKGHHLLELLQKIGQVTPDTILPPLQSEPWHYRSKARLSVRYVEKKQATLVGFRERHNPRYITEIENCSILDKRVDNEILQLRQLIDGLDDPKTIAQIEVAAGEDKVALIFRNLKPLSLADETALIAFAKRTQFLIFLQPAGPDSVFLLYPREGSPYLSYSLKTEGINFLFHPMDFTQINFGMNQQMVTRALSLLQITEQDHVLDLFCGLGNFSIPIAHKACKVTAIEGSTSSLERAAMNAARQGYQNIHFLPYDLSTPLPLTTLKLEPFTKILLDPPRAGAFEVVKDQRIRQAHRIVYVSCNPATLARDAKVLVEDQGYQLEAAGVMDMFPHTNHVESIALFCKR